MAKVMNVPELGPGTEEVTIVRISVSVGDEVVRGQILAEVESVKGVLEVEATESGTVTSILVSEGDEVAVGEVLAMIDTAPDGAARDGKAITEVAAPESQGEAPATEEGGPGIAGARANDDRGDRDGKRDAEPARVRSTPSVRRQAREMGVDLRDITGTGPQGRVTRHDLERAVDSEAPCSKSKEGLRESVEGWRASAVQLSAARRLEEAVKIPTYALEVNIKAEAVTQLQYQLRKAMSAKITLTDLLVKAAGLALADFPEVDVLWKSGHIEPLQSQNVRLAVAAGTELFVPTLYDVARAPLSRIAQQRAKVVDTVKCGDAQELARNAAGSASLTVSNLGMFGVDAVYPLIDPQGSMIIGIGRVVEASTVERAQFGGEGSATMRVVLIADHRPINGHVAAKFLATLRDYMEEPLRLLI